MTTPQTNQIVDRASAELDRLVAEARDGAKSAEELVTGSIENLQHLVEDLFGWVTDELDRMRAQADDQRSRIEAQLSDLVGSVREPVQRADRKSVV